MTTDLDNAAIAQQLEAFAGLLDLSGSSFYTSRAYRRAAETIRDTKAPIAELVAAGRVQELRGIGPGIATRLRELVETGRIAELEELQREVHPELVGLGRFLNVSPKRMVEIGRTLGVSTADEFRAAAREGRLKSVPGIGPQTEQRILAALDREGEPQRRGVLLNRARALVEEIAPQWAASLQVIRAAGPTRRSTSPSSRRRPTPNRCSTRLPHSPRSSRCSSVTRGAQSA
jgi:DNA polymerase (family 10)